MDVRDYATFRRDDPDTVDARNYATFPRHSPDGYRVYYSESDPYDDELVKSLDNMLHRTLSEIFRQRCLTSDQDSIIQLIPKLEPALSVIFPAEHNNKFSLLWITVLSCYQRSAELLVRSGADVNERFGTSLHEDLLDEESTILHCLLEMYPSSWNERFVGLLTEHGADLQARDSYGWTALHCAAKSSRVEVAKMLLERGVDVNAADKNGNRTPLLIAARSNVADELMTLLLDHGADVTVRDAEGMNALHHFAFASVERPDQARVLIEKGASLDDRRHSDQYEPLYLAAKKGKVDLVKLFLERSGADVNARRAEDGSFLLYVAARRVQIDAYFTIGGLLELGADIDLKTNEGWTALHVACCKEFSEYDSIDVLQYYGADICAEDHEGNTPYSLMDTQADSDSCVRLMLRVLALKKTWLQPSSALKEERRIRKHPDRWKYYQGCVEEVRKMQSTSLIMTWTFFDVMTKCHCRTAELMRNREFDSKLKQHKLRKVFPKYYKDIDNFIGSTKRYYRSMLKLEGIIDEAFYNILPHMIVRKVAHYAIDCRDCRIKRIVNASRSVEQRR